jgi:archaellum component FlaC
VHAATLRKTESELDRVRKQRSDIEKQLGRIEKAPANDFLSYALKEEIRAFDEQIGNIKSKIETMETAVEILNEYVFTVEERSEESLYDMGQILNTFTSSAGTGGW